MKKLFTLFLSLIASAGTLIASDTQVDGIWYDFNESNRTALVTYQGSYTSSYNNEYSGSVSIPTSVSYNDKTYNVTSIGSSAFYGCSGLTSVTIPNSVTSIGSYAFDGCSGLTSVTIPNSVTSIGSGTFQNCTGLTSITIPNSVTSIGSGTFQNCTGLTSITIPNSVTSIGSYAFSNCTGLTSVHISDIAAWCAIYFTNDVHSSPLYYAHNLYLNGELITNLVIPSSVTSIGMYAFSWCTGLTSITIPNSVTSISVYAFTGCSSLTTVILNSNAIVSKNYTSTSSLQDIFGSQVTKYIIEDNVTSIGSYAFYACTGLTTLTISNGVTSIGDYAFYGCTGLNSAIIGSGVASIGKSAFYKCTGITSITIPSSVTSIGDQAFNNVPNIIYYGTAIGSPWGARNLNGYTDGYLVYEDETKTKLCGCSSAAQGEFVIPSSVTSIGNSAFNGCSDLTSITIPNSVTSIGSSAFNGCSGLTSVTIPNSVTSIGSYAFDGCSGLTSVILNSNAIVSRSYNSNLGLKYFFGSQVTEYIIGDSVTSIGSSVFSGCTDLKSVTIPNSITGIGSSAFSNCTHLTSINIPNSVTSIGSRAFYKCTGLTSITIPNGVTSIGDWVFSGCRWLSRVTIGNNVISIGNSAFFDCTSLTMVTLNSNAVVSKNYTSTSSLQDIFGSQVTKYIIGDSVTSIGSYAFYACTGLTSVTIGNNVYSIGNYAFSNCTGLTSVYISDIAAWCSILFESSSANPLYYAHDLYLNGELITNLVIPDSVTNIGNFAFYLCSCLKSVTLGNSVTNIGGYAFDNCKSLTSISIPNSVTSIGNSAFYNCTGLKSVTMGNNVTSIGNAAFYDCTGLKSVYISNIASWCGISFGRYDSNPLSYAHNLYLNGELITNLVVPNSVTGIGSSAFNGCSGLTSVTIPNSVTSVGSYAFSGCTSLTSVSMLSETPPTLGELAFYNVASDCSIIVPCGTLDTYKSAWNSYSSRIKNTSSTYHVTLQADADKGYVDAPTLTECGEDSYTMAAVAKYGYSFVQWSDGNTDNPRVAAITSDTTFTAEFDYAKSGTCGDGNALTWVYNSTTKTLTISGTGALNSNYTYGLEAPGQMEHLVLDEGVTSVGDKAFKGETYLTTISLCSTLTSVGDSAFAGCKRLEEITLYATTVPDIVASSFANVGNKKYINLYVCEGRTNAYLRDEYWGEFNVQVKAASTVTDPVSDVTITPTENAAQIVWPVNSSAASYTIDISKEGTLVCTLTFNAAGQLTGIAFAAPGIRHDDAQDAATGFSFTITSLDPGTTYNYSVIAKNSGGTAIDTKTGTFKTLPLSGLEEIFSASNAADSKKIFIDGQIYILRDGKAYDLTGKEL